VEIHQFLTAAAPGDAVTNTALAQRELLRRLGPSEVFAYHVHPDLAGEVFTLDRYPSRRSARLGKDLLIVHMSIGSPELMAFLDGRPERLALMYHNISPADAFAPFDAPFASLLELGRRELVELARRCEFALACSSFNAAELEALGVTRIAIVPPVPDLAGLLATEPHPPTVHHLQEKVDGPVVLLVAQVAPHKCQHEVVAAFHVLSTYLCPDAHLFMVGGSPTPAYAQLVQRYIEGLVLPRASLLGRIGVAELAAFYRHASVFVTLSRHEGFCVPLVEAMAFGVPVVARAAAAIPETVGDAGLLLGDEPTPELVAEAMAAILADDVLRKDLVGRGQERAEQFVGEVTGHRFVAALERFV
jgi:glycosyltransferase involved in cell wall biosynthesis